MINLRTKPYWHHEFQSMMTNHVRLEGLKHLSGYISQNMTVEKNIRAQVDNNRSIEAIPTIRQDLWC